MRQVAVKFKTCSRCKNVKALEDFPVQSSRADGRHTHCKTCRSEYYASTYSLEKRRKQHYRDHTKSKEQHKNYYQRNKDKYYVNKQKRKELTKQATPAWSSDFDEFVLSEAYKLCKLREQTTNIKWEIDHIVPLQGYNVCGLHWHKNWRVIPMVLNRQKGNKYDNRDELYRRDDARL